MKPTPGLWTVNADSAEIESGTEVIVQFSQRFTKQEQANARLIAAAPELLRWLKFVIELVPPRYQDGVASARAVIAKVEGTS